MPLLYLVFLYSIIAQPTYDDRCNVPIHSRSHITRFLKIDYDIHSLHFKNNERTHETHHRRKLQNTATRARAQTNKQTHNIVPTLPLVF